MSNHHGPCPVHLSEGTCGACLLARALDAEQRADNLEQRLVDLRRAWPKDPRYVSATPDADYPRRILESYLDVTTLSGAALGAGGQKLADILNQAQAERNHILHEAVATLSRASLPVPMILHCPFCHRQHVDAPNEAEGWTNPPHKSHLCSYCSWDCDGYNQPPRPGHLWPEEWREMQAPPVAPAAEETRDE